MLYWREYLWHYWGFSGPGELFRPCPPRYALIADPQIILNFKQYIILIFFTTIASEESIAKLSRMIYPCGTIRIAIKNETKQHGLREMGTKGTSGPGA